MALLTGGTSATTSLTGLLFKPGIGSIPAADMALLDLIKDDKNVSHPLIPTCMDSGGLLNIPNRGQVQVLPGDYVFIDSRGWPIVLSADTIANGPWTHS